MTYPTNKDHCPPSSTPITVGIDASGGNHEALEQIFTCIPSDCNLSFVVVMPLPVSDPSVLSEIIRRYTTMDVLNIAEAMQLKPNTVYVIPHGKNLTVREGRLQLHLPDEKSGPHRPIDVFFTSLANELRERAIAVILSGYGIDGSQGIQRINDVGGIVMVQQPESTNSSAMPANAITPGTADFILSAKDIASEIVNISVANSHISGHPCMETPEGLPTLFTILEAKTGHDFSSYKRNTVLRRIDRRMVENRETNFKNYLTILKENDQEAQTLCQELLIGVTSFFRDPEAFDLLSSEIIPRLFVNRAPEEPVRIWHACCSTGQEAYSVAILIREYMEKENVEAKVQIFASDLDEESVLQAKSGLYTDDMASEMSEDRLTRFFTREEGSWRVSKQLREMIVFAHHSIIKNPPFSRLDLLVCRNFLIYLDPEMQKRLIPLFHQILNPKGILFLGSAETVGPYNNLFTPIDKKWKIFMRQEAERSVETLFPYSRPVRTINHIGISDQKSAVQKPDSFALAEKLMIERYCPARVIVNEKNEVVHFSHRTSDYLLMPAGEPTRDLLKLARKELRPALRAATYKAFTDLKENAFRNITIPADSGKTAVNVIVVPFKAPPPSGNLALVIFEPVLPPPLQSTFFEEENSGNGVDGVHCGSLIRQLEEQLRDKSEQLQATSEQLETSNHSFQSANEELMSTNEELQSANEELQATNEELETSKEELQALNEELITVNTELHEKMEELSQSNSDMENLFTCSEIATIFLDRQLIIKRFSPAMAAIFDLIPADIGRPFRYLNGTINWPDLADDTASVLETLVPVEREVTAQGDKRCFIMRVLPYRTSKGLIVGIVITLSDITQRKQMEKALRESEQRLGLFIDQAPASLAMFDTEMRYLSVSRRWLQDYGLDDQNLIGKSHYEIFPEIPEKWKKAHRLGMAGEILWAEADRFERMDGSVQWIRWEVQPWTDVAGNIGGIVIFTEDITNIKKSEDILRRYELLAKYSRDIILFMRLEDGQILEANSAAVNAYGYTHEELLQLTLEDLRAFPTTEKPDTRMIEAYTHGILMETSHRRKDGTIIPVEVNAQGAIIDSTPMMLGVIRDITERKQAEQTRAQLASIVKYSDDAIIAKNLDGLILSWNFGAEQLFGYTAEEAIGRPITFLIPPEMHSEERRILQKISTGDRLNHFETVRCHKDGRRIDVSLTISPIYDQERKIIGISKIARDITEQKKAEKSLRKNEELLRRAQEAAQAGTWEWNLSTNENTWSDQLWKLYGLEPNVRQASYNIWLELVHPKDRKRIEKTIQEAVVNKTELNVEWRVCLPDGNYRWLMSRGNPQLDANGEVESYLGIVIDITETKQAEDERKILWSQLIQAQKMEAIGTLAGGIAHDFNNILGAILGFAEIAQEESLPDSPVARDLAQILTAGKRAKDLVKQILAFSRQTESKRMPLQPAPIVLEALKLLRSSLPTTIAIEQNIDMACDLILADPTHLHQIIMNICTNAYHAMEMTGGTISLSLTNQTILERDLATIPHVHPGNFVQLSITDNGPGIPHDVREKIFDPYFTTKETGKGTGMGLAIVHGIVTSYGGCITCHSQVGEGTIFTVSLPAMEKQTDIDNPSIQGTTGGTERILYVDDEQMLVEMGQIMLNRLGYQVTICTSSLEALTLFKNQPDAFDLVITDQTMPEMTGFELAGHMLQLRPNLPIILCTGFSSIISEEKVKSLGIKAFAAKPLTKKDITTLIRKVLDGETTE